MNLRLAMPAPGTPVAAGVYADAAMVWCTQHGFTIDILSASAPPHPDEEDDGKVVQDAAVVSRVRVPVSVIFQLARAIGEQVATYEAQFGPIPAGGPTHPPEEAG